MDPVMKIVTPPPAQIRVVLELSVDEAAALYDVLRHVGGEPRLSRRHHTDAILKVMSNTFHPENYYRKTNLPYPEDMNGTVYFTPSRREDK